MKYFNSSEEFAVHILKAVCEGWNPCNSDCINNCTLIIQLFSGEVLQDLRIKKYSFYYSFKYSLKTESYPFDLVEQFYSIFQGFKGVSVLMMVNQVCEQ